jgi:hypothetical protein
MQKVREINQNVLVDGLVFGVTLRLLDRRYAVSYKVILVDRSAVFYVFEVNVENEQEALALAARSESGLGEVVGEGEGAEYNAVPNTTWTSDFAAHGLQDGVEQIAWYEGDGYTKIEPDDDCKDEPYMRCNHREQDWNLFDILCDYDTILIKKQEATK